MRSLREENGQVLLFIALFMGLAMLGFLALALDIGYMFHEKRMAQAAADGAAVAAAEEIVANDSANEQEAANAIAKLNGFDPTLEKNPAVVTLVSGSNAVTVTVSKPIPTFFLGALTHGMGGMSTLTVAAAATASANQASPSCICLEGATGTDLNMSNDAQLNAITCGITADSNGSKASPVKVVGSASVNALSLSTVGTGWNDISNINNMGTLNNTKVITGLTTPCAPAIAAPPLPNGITCYSDPISQYGYSLAANSLNSNNYNGDYTLPFEGASYMSNGKAVAIPNEVATSNTICYNGLSLADAAKIVFSPGYTYYINGNFTTGGGASISGTGVTFEITGNIDIANGVTVNLSAPTDSNGIPGTLFYDTGTSVIVEGGSNSNFSGMIDAPNAAVTLDNGTGTTTNMDIVAQTLTMAGGAALNSYASPALGTLNTSTAKLTQ